MTNNQPESIVRCTSCGEVIEPPYKGHHCTVTIGYSSNSVSYFDLAKALDDLILQDAPPPLADDDLTARMVAERAGCEKQKARKMLIKWAADGKAEYIGKRREPSGQSVDAWRLKGNE
jgi:DNA-directed RNA polymerase subunit N (RpoN/RPB10)